MVVIGRATPAWRDKTFTAAATDLIRKFHLANVSVLIRFRRYICGEALS